jgi:hypothetical protein
MQVPRLCYIETVPYLQDVPQSRESRAAVPSDTDRCMESNRTQNKTYVYDASDAELHSSSARLRQLLIPSCGSEEEETLGLPWGPSFSDIEQKHQLKHVSTA